jgi:hypothetical protein
MRFPGTKQTLHWLFLAVGIISVILMALSVLTYLNYAEDGYGLKVSVTEAWLSEERLVIRLRVENPGGLDIDLGGTGTDGNLTLGTVYPISLISTRIKADNTTTVIIYVDLTQADLDAIRNTGSADIALNLRLYVPERDLVTNLAVEEEGVEVVT